MLPEGGAFVERGIESLRRQMLSPYKIELFYAECAPRCSPTTIVEPERKISWQGRDQRAYLTHDVLGDMATSKRFLRSLAPWLRFTRGQRVMHRKGWRKNGEPDGEG